MDDRELDINRLLNTKVATSNVTISTHYFIQVACEVCRRMVFGIEDTSPGKNGSINLKTDTGVSIVILCEDCKGLAKANVIHLFKPLSMPKEAAENG